MAKVIAVKIRYKFWRLRSEVYGEVVVAQLVERSLMTSEVHCLNPVAKFTLNIVYYQQY